jgi:hypothetical protein
MLTSIITKRFLYPCLLGVLISVSLVGCLKKKSDVKEKIDESYSTIRRELCRLDHRSAEAKFNAHVSRLEIEWQSASEDSDEAKIAQGVRDRLLLTKSDLLTPVPVERHPVKVEKPVQTDESPENALRKRYEEWTKQNLPQLNLLITNVRQEIRLRSKNMEELESIMNFHNRNPRSDSHCKNAHEQIRELQKSLSALEELRLDTYLSAEKVVHIPIPRNQQDQLSELLATALEQVKKHQKTYERTLSESSTNLVTRKN